jgi:hypothetical protein
MLPSWLTRNDAGSYIVDQAIAYALALEGLAIDAAKATAQELELAFQCIRMKVEDIVSDQPDDPRAEGKNLKIFFEGDADSKEKYRQIDKPRGKSFSKAEVKEHYKKIRGKLSV